ncbi:MAG TPA: CARDB domain-containing protein, partial [Candidatus Paceibacterota bacterium]|nr:CARDB domain-containing protein [Candidatus Paceibacterota bacterium]
QGIGNADAAPLRFSAGEQDVFLNNEFKASTTVYVVPPTAGELTSYLNNPPTGGGGSYNANCSGYGSTSEAACNTVLGTTNWDLRPSYGAPGITAQYQNQNGSWINIPLVRCGNEWISGTGCDTSLHSQVSGGYLTLKANKANYPDGVVVSFRQVKGQSYVPTFRIKPFFEKGQWALSGGTTWARVRTDMGEDPGSFIVRFKSKLDSNPRFVCMDSIQTTASATLFYNGNTFTYSTPGSSLTVPDFPENLLSSAVAVAGNPATINFTAKPISLVTQPYFTNVTVRYMPKIGGFDDIATFTTIGVTVMPQGVTCGNTTTITGDNITLNPEDPIIRTKAYSVSTNNSNPLPVWQASWVGDLVSGVSITEPLPRMTFIGQGDPACQGGENELTFLEKIFRKISYAASTCWTYELPSGLTTSVGISTRLLESETVPPDGMIRTLRLVTSGPGGTGTKDVVVNIASLQTNVNPSVVEAVPGGASVSVTVNASKAYVNPGIVFDSESLSDDILSNIGGSGDSTRPLTIRAASGTPAGNYTIKVKASGTNLDGIPITSEMFGETVVTVVVKGVDLTAGPITPTTVNAGQSVQYSSTISNLGALSTGAGFPVLFQWTNIDPNGATSAFAPNGDSGNAFFSIPTAHAQTGCVPTASTPCVLNTVSTAALGANSSRIVQSLAHTFQTGGTYWMRACADKNSPSHAGVIAESDENNNCGHPWTRITVGSIADLVVNKATLSPTAPAIGTPTTFSATVTNQGTTSTIVAFPNIVRITDTDPTQAPVTGSRFIKTVHAAFDNFYGVGTKGPLAVGGTATLTYTYTPTQAGKQWVQFCADQTSPNMGSVVSEADEGNNCGAWTEYTVSGLSDLTAGTVTPGTALTGTTTFYAPITNQSSTPTPTGVTFTNVFQLANYNPDSSSTGGSGSSFNLKNLIKQAFAQVGEEQNWIQNYTTLTSMSNFAAGETKVANRPIAIPTAGEYWIRACADLPLPGKITESEEENNCSGWRKIVVGNLPDLTASAVTPTYATMNVPVTLTSTISNIGLTGTGASFSNFFQVANYDPTPPPPPAGSGTSFNFWKEVFAAEEQGIVDYPATLMNALSAGGNNGTSTSVTFPSIGSYWARACADKSSSANAGTINELYENNNCGPWTEVIVGSDMLLPDLITSPVTPNKAIVGENQLFVAVVTNQGTTSTNGGFPFFFQISDGDPSGGRASNDGFFARFNIFKLLGPKTIAQVGEQDPGGGPGGNEIEEPTINESPAGWAPVLAPGEKTNISEYLSFDKENTYWVRACADMASSGDEGVIEESDENNNCGGWVAVEVLSADQSFGQLSAEDCLIFAGESTCSSTVTWSVTNPLGETAVTKNVPEPNTIIATDPQGSVGDEIGYGRTNYYLYHSGNELASDGANASCARGTVWNDRDGQCTVVNFSPTAYLSVTPNTIIAGESATLSWYSYNTESCEGTGFSTDGKVNGGDVSVSPTTTTTYAIVCTGPSGQAAHSALLTVTTKEKKPIYKEN